VVVVGKEARLTDSLPVLVPELNYDGLAIRDGGEATAAYIRLMENNLPDKERADLRAGLLAYCGQDTKAMVRILGVLREIVKS
jgi:hypothetical protein